MARGAHPASLAESRAASRPPHLASPTSHPVNRRPPAHLKTQMVKIWSKAASQTDRALQKRNQRVVKSKVVLGCKA
eukprot:scaffold34046_cov69-Phaeocystis_antarctica.AAC.6